MPDFPRTGTCRRSAASPPSAARLPVKFRSSINQRTRVAEHANRRNIIAVASPAIPCFLPASAEEIAAILWPCKNRPPPRFPHLPPRQSPRGGTYHLDPASTIRLPALSALAFAKSRKSPGIRIHPNPAVHAPRPPASQANR